MRGSTRAHSSPLFLVNVAPHFGHAIVPPSFGGLPRFFGTSAAPAVFLHFSTSETVCFAWAFGTAAGRESAAATREAKAEPSPSPATPASVAADPADWEDWRRDIFLKAAVGLLGPPSPGILLPFCRWQRASWGLKKKQLFV